jgi:hypothetical protein
VSYTSELKSFLDSLAAFQKKVENIVDGVEGLFEGLGNILNNAGKKVIRGVTWLASKSNLPVLPKELKVPNADFEAKHREGKVSWTGTNTYMTYNIFRDGMNGRPHRVSDPLNCPGRPAIEFEIDQTKDMDAKWKQEFRPWSLLNLGSLSIVVGTELTLKDFKLTAISIPTNKILGVGDARPSNFVVENASGRGELKLAAYVDVAANAGRFFHADVQGGLKSSSSYSVGPNASNTGLSVTFDTQNLAFRYRAEVGSEMLGWLPQSKEGEVQLLQKQAPATNIAQFAPASN